MSEKLDGIRAYSNGKVLLSRSGKVIHTPTYFTNNFPPFEIDGELWTKRGDFENISSIVRKNSPTKEWQEISYHIFEVPNAKGNLFERLDKVKPYKSKILKIIKQKTIKDKAELKSFLKEIEDKNGEGIVVRNPKAPYINHRTNQALKVKSFKDSECEVLGYTNGKGKFKGLVGAIICKLSNGIEFKVGSGLTLKDRQNPPKIGTMITFKYQNLTKYKKPRFPVFLRCRSE